MKPHAMSCFCHRQNHLKTIPNLLSLCVIILSFLALLHFSYRHVLFQLSFYACSNPSSSSSASANSSSSAIATAAAAAIGPPGVGGANSTSGANATAECDIFRGEWVPDPEGPYYTNVTCTMIQDHQNCMRFGRPDREFLQWRWKPEGCELPRFDPHRFLELARGKSMAFVGDSLARNHMQSLLCLLSGVEYPDDISNTRDENRRLFYSDYNFTVSIFWSPFLIKGGAAGGVDNLWNLYLDEVDDNWAARVQAVDILIISSGTWFTRPSIYFKKRQPFGCNYCAQSPNLTRVSLYSVNRAAFRSAFKAIGKLRGFRGVTVLRTVSPSHFENGKWDQGGSCNRTRPARREETRLEAVELEMYRAQVKEFERARREWERTGLQLKMMDATAAMLMRPDGHPDVYGHRPEQRVQLHNDCVHWCLPGPIDLWNDLLLQMLSNRASEQSGTQQIIP